MKDKAIALEDLDKAIVDVLKASRESGMKLKLSGFEAKLDVDVVPGMIAAFGGWQLGLSLTEALLLGAASAAPKFSIKAGLGLKAHKAASNNPFEYVSKFHRDLF